MEETDRGGKKNCLNRLSDGEGEEAPADIN